MMHIIIKRSHQKIENNPPEGTCACDSCDHLTRKYSKKNNNYWMYTCSKRGDGFDIAPEYCKDYKRRKSNI